MNLVAKEIEKHKVCSRASKQDVERLLEAGKLLLAVLTEGETENLQKEILHLNGDHKYEKSKNKIGNTHVA